MKYLFLLLIVVGCYTRKKAEHQINMAAVTFPDILAKKARDLFPCVTSKGDTVWVSDSADYKEVMKIIQDENLKLYLSKDSLDKALKEAKSDTVCFTIVDMYKAALDKRDKEIANLIYQLAHIPPVKIIQTIHDTTVDNAAVRACEIDKNTAISLLDKKTTESDGWHSKAKKRYYIMWGLILLVVGATGYKLYSMFKPKLK